MVPEDTRSIIGRWLPFPHLDVFAIPTSRVPVAAQRASGRDADEVVVATSLHRTYRTYRTWGCQHIKQQHFRWWIRNMNETGVGKSPNYAHCRDTLQQIPKKSSDVKKIQNWISTSKPSKTPVVQNTYFLNEQIGRLAVSECRLSPRHRPKAAARCP